MTKYICKAKDTSETEMDSVYTLHVQSEKNPYEVAKFLSQLAGKRVANLHVPSMFRIPELWEMDECNMYSHERTFRIYFSEGNGYATSEISIEKVDCEYVDIDDLT